MTHIHTKAYTIVLTITTHIAEKRDTRTYLVIHMACTLPCKYLYMNENIELIVCWLGVPSVTHYTQPYLWIFYKPMFAYVCCCFYCIMELYMLYMFQYIYGNTKHKIKYYNDCIYFVMLSIENLINASHGKALFPIYINVSII